MRELHLDLETRSACDLKAAGLLESVHAVNGEAPRPDDDPELDENEDPLEFGFAGLDGEGAADDESEGTRLDA